jgi:hypothetical protein
MICSKRTGCVKHTAVTSAIIYYAKENKKSINILYLDLRGPFGSVLYDLINKNMEQVGIRKCLRKIIFNSYDGTFINMQVKNGETDDLHIRKCVKQ